MLLESLLPVLPTAGSAWAILLAGIFGTIFLIYSQFVEAENRRDLIRMLGAGGLFVYALSIENIIFLIATGGIFLAALIEFIEIFLGFHKHTPGDIKEYIRKYKH